MKIYVGLIGLNVVAVTMSVANAMIGGCCATMSPRRLRVARRLLSYFRPTLYNTAVFSLSFRPLVVSPLLSGLLNYDFFSSIPSI